LHCLIIGKVWPEPDSTAAGRRILDIVQAFQAVGHKVSFATAARQTEHCLDLEALDVSVYAVQPNNSDFDSWIAALEPELVLFDRFMIEEQFGWRVEKACPTALRVLDTSDLHCLREARRVRLKSGGELNLYNDVALREVAAIHRSDLTLMIADYEVELLIAEFGIPERQVAYLPFWLELDEAEFKPFESRQDFMMIGSFMHPPNVDAARWFKQAIWPLIREELPQAEFHCYGAYGDRYKTEFHDPGNGFIYKGRADDALLTMQNYRVNCVPLRYGAGLKGKVFDGFQTGTPTVTTPVGAEGINGNEAWGCTISDDPETFARTAVELYTNAEGWAKVQAQGQHIARKRFGANKWLPRLTQVIETALAQMNENRKRHFTGRMLRHHQHRSTEYMSRWIEAKNR
jgi:glycosyltransferase involved in cell wall biosynthesis